MKGSPAGPGGSLTGKPTWPNTFEVFGHVGFFLSERRRVAMRPESASTRWATLQAKAHLPEVQAMIRCEIARGTVRVVPAPGGGIRIIPTSGTSPVEKPELSAASGLALDDNHRRVPVLRIERITR
jgi:hypothetical protein